MLVTLNLIKFSSLFVSIFTFKYLCVKVVRGRDVRAIVIWEYFYFLVTSTPLVGWYYVSERLPSVYYLEYWAKRFVHIFSFNHHSNLWKQIQWSSLLDKLRLRKVRIFITKELQNWQLNFNLSHSKSHALKLHVIPSSHSILGGKLSQWRLQKHLRYFFIFLFLYLRNGYAEYKKQFLSVYLALYKSASVQVDIICTSVIVLCNALKRKDFLWVRFFTICLH